ncbi:MAG: OB-fold nucleic acid binding domain-containing protein, partial [Clostridia bacterium]|nr:OB-fold nucleic acid binding domain-containing protein [Clostridia bacterium]
FRDCTFTTAMLANTAGDEEEDGDSEDGQVTYTDVENDMPVFLGGIITEVSRIATKSGAFMAFATVEDIYGSIECVFFPSKYDKFKELVQVEQVVKIRGKLQIREDKVSVLADYIESVNQVIDKEEKVSRPLIDYLGIVLNDETKNSKDELIDILSSYPGNITVVVKMDGKNYKLTQKVRRCQGLIMELLSIIDENDIKFFKA